MVSETIIKQFDFTAVGNLNVITFLIPHEFQPFKKQETTHMTNSRLTDPEVLEWRFPVLLESFSMRSNSGRKGKWHGGYGIERRIRFLESMTASILANHHRVPPFGLKGGKAGHVGKAWIERQDGRIDNLKATDTSEMETDDVFVIQTPGGGGLWLLGLAEPTYTLLV